MSENNNPIDFKKARIKKRNNNLQETYLKAEEVISNIKAEYINLLNGTAKDESHYNQMLKEFDTLEFALGEYWYYEFHNRLYMSLLSIQAVYGHDEETKEDAKNRFSIENEVLNLLDIKHGRDDIKFREEYKKAVLEELEEE